MSLLGLIALISGSLGVWLTIRQNIWCWPMALVSVVASGIDFYNSRLFGDMALQVMYFAQGVYGWVVWHKRKSESFMAIRMPRSYWVYVGGSIALLWLVFYYVLIYVKGNRAVLDALLTAGSLVTTYMMTKKWAENWVLWVLIDATYVLLYTLTNLQMYAALYLLFTVMAFYGWMQWRKSTS